MILFAVFNYWEPLHYLHKGYGFQTWETSPQYAIRSWAYTLLWLLPSKIPFWILREMGKVSSSMQVRSCIFQPLHCRDRLFSSCVLSWALYAPSVRPSYTTPSGSRSTTASLATCYSCWLLMLACGMHRRVSLLFDTSISSPPLFFESDFFLALLPSSLAMYTTMLALSHAFIPPSNKDSQRTLAAVMYFTLGAVLGWPFALAIAIPFVAEELFVFGADQVTAKEKLEWQLNRGIRLLLCGAVAAIIPVSMMLCLRLAFAERCADTCSRHRFILLWQAHCSVLEYREV